MTAGKGTAPSRRHAAWVVLPATLLALAAPVASFASAPTPTPPPGETTATITRLSDLRTTSRWAYPTYEAFARSAPSVKARGIDRLRLLTDDGQAALYVALASKRLQSGQTWVRLELPGRPNGRTGWAPRGALGTLHVVNGRLRIDERNLRATLFRGGRAIFSAPVGVGKSSTVTPAGRFYVMEKLITRDSPVYGPYALGTSAYAPTLSEWPGGGVVGIHGTDEPQLIPGRPSHGCIRLRNADIIRLWHTIALGTPIEIIK
jgi:hypothetical protein